MPSSKALMLFVVNRLVWLPGDLRPALVAPPGRVVTGRPHQPRVRVRPAVVDQFRYDGSVVAPASSARVGGIRQDDGSTSLHRDLLHVVISEESDPLAVGGEERIDGVVRASQKCGLGLIERPSGQKLFSIRAACRIHHPSRVG